MPPVTYHLRTSSNIHLTKKNIYLQGNRSSHSQTIWAQNPVWHSAGKRPLRNYPIFHTRLKYMGGPSPGRYSRIDWGIDRCWIENRMQRSNRQATAEEYWSSERFVCSEQMSQRFDINNTLSLFSISFAGDVQNYEASVNLSDLEVALSLMAPTMVALSIKHKEWNKKFGGHTAAWAL